MLSTGLLSYLIMFLRCPFFIFKTALYCDVLGQGFEPLPLSFSGSVWCLLHTFVAVLLGILAPLCSQ